ncbi:MAG: hypothetical protein A3B70_07510 [Deltaproteobacteria bacterium RIFCSPHIGHO2_02_FULL_40_11]|nr:MAG: hypothetical protein A3B70_07510 [Deltaproteobacteria bacterium RIFCSPHIGHO2_02_FULL_40_11]
MQSKSFRFEWDKGNAKKSAEKHGITQEEVESVFTLNLAVPIGRQVSPKVDEERLCIVGPAVSGQLTSIVFTLREGKVRPISSRIASRKERRLYEEIREALKNV